jgi:hypothetical protein
MEALWSFPTSRHLEAMSRAALLGYVQQDAFLPQQKHDRFSDRHSRRSDTDDGQDELLGTTDGAYISGIGRTDHLCKEREGTFAW